MLSVNDIANPKKKKNRRLFLSVVLLVLACVAGVVLLNKKNSTFEISQASFGDNQSEADFSSEFITDVVHQIEDGMRIVTEHHADANIPYITVYQYPVVDQVTGAAVPPPENVGGTNYYRVISTDSDEDSGDEVCAIALNTSCTGYVDESVTGFNVCKAFHPTASEVTDTDGDLSTVYCNGNPQAAPCNTLSNTCLACPTCTNGVACNEAIGGLYREMYVTCTASAAVGTDLCTAGLDDDDGSGDGILDLTATETSFDNTSIIIDGCEIAIDGTHTFTNVTVRRNGRLTQSASGTGAFNTTNITVTGHTEVAIGSSIDVNGKGVAGQNHVNPAISTTNPQAGAKNVHAGTLSTDPTEVYGDYFNPIYPGSGGTKANGNGGGVLHLTLNTLELEGDISADSSNPSLCGGTTGAGGSVKINITGEMTGDGTITANALPCTNATSDGSGGRVAIFYTTSGGINTEDPTQEYTVQAVNESTNDGTPGTIYLEDATEVGVLYNANEGRLIVDESTFSHEKDGGGGGLEDDMNVVLPATVTLHTLEIDDARVTMAPSGTATLNIDSLSGAGLLDIRDGGELTYTDMTSLGLIKKLIIDATGSTIQVDATSLIDARGKGAIRNEQIDPDSSTTNAVAGLNTSHGGLGNDTDSIDAVYGDFWDPQWPGSGANSSANAKGGGYIGITAETFTHNGEIRADGNNMSCFVPAPAGGSVKITTTGTYSGSGTIQANAGACTNGGGTQSGAGRVAFYYTTAGSINATPPDQQFTLEAHAKLPASNDGSAGTVYIEDAQAVTNGDYLTGQGILIIDNNVAVENVQGTPILGTVNLYELRINNAIATAETLNIANALTLTNSASLKHQPMVTLGLIRRLTINADNAAVSVDATSSIDAQGLGTVGTDKIDPGTSTTNAIDGSNTSHGGVGGTDASEAYGDFFNPIYPGSGGSYSGSRGGGVIDLHANTLDLEGTITAAGRVHGGCGGSAASGGAVKIQVDSTYTGSGTVSVDSGNCTNTSSTASGGRLAFFYTTAGSINATAPDAQFTLSSYALDVNGAAGTVYIEDANAVTLGTYSANQGRLIVKDVSVTNETTGAPLLGTLNLYELLLDGGRVTAETIVVENQITLQNGSLLRTEPMVSLGAIKQLLLNSPNADLSIDATSEINVSALGVTGGQSINPQVSTTNAIAGANRGHGGIFGTDYSRSYGDFRDPIWPGSGGSSGTRLGGGVVTIAVADFDLNGTIRANAQNGGGCGGNYGSGGSIKVTTTGELTGSGVLEAEGSRCTNSGTQTNGGGRIGFFYDSDPAGSVSNASPETLYTFDTTFENAGTNPAGPGTTYIEDDNATNGDTNGQGDLIINGESQSSLYSTPLFNDETPTSLTLTNVTVINGADLILTSPCTGTLTVTGTIDLSGGGSITDNTAGACTTSFASLSVGTTIDNGVNAQAYSDYVPSAGGYAPKTFECLDGLGGSVVTCNTGAGLPAGLTMSSAGLVSGVPSVSGTFNFVVRVTDSDPGGAQTAENTVSFTIGSVPNAPVLVSPGNGDESGSLTPTLTATYSDPDAGDTGTIDFRVSSSSSGDCLTGTNIVSTGTSAETATNNENASFVVSTTLTAAQTYYWCARANDGAFFDNSGAYTSMGNFVATEPAGSNQKFQAQQPENQPPAETPDTETPTEESPSETEEPTEETPEETTAPEVPADETPEEPVITPEPTQPEESLPTQEQDEAPGDLAPPPAQPEPTQEDTSQIDDIVDELIQIEDEQSPVSTPSQSTEPPSQVGLETRSQSDGRSFTVEVEDVVLEESLVVTGLASTDEDRLEFSGETSLPNSTVTLIFDDSVFVVVTSDEEGFWQAFVSAQELGVSAGQSAVVSVEVIAVKDNLRSEKVSVGETQISLSNDEQVVAEFDSQVSEAAVMTIARRLQEDVMEFLQDEEQTIQRSLAVATPVVIVSSAPLWGYAPYIPTLSYQFFLWIFGAFRRKRKEGRLYGIAYDSITKEPVALAIVRIYQTIEGQRKLVSTVVTDKSGRYESLLEPGEYAIEVIKPQYSFPSSLVSGEVDGDFQHVSHGSLNMNEGSIGLPDLPLDPNNATKNWEFAGFLKKLVLGLQKIGTHLALPLMFIGALGSALLLINNSFAPENWILLFLYIGMMLLQLNLRQHPQKAWGIVYDLATGAALPLVNLQLIDPEFGKVVKSRLSDYEGRFAFLPEPGKYVIKASKPGYSQPEIVESSGDLNPIQGELEIKKDGEVIDGDIALKLS